MPYSTPEALLTMFYFGDINPVALENVQAFIWLGHFSDWSAPPGIEGVVRNNNRNSALRVLCKG